MPPTISSPHPISIQHVKQYMQSQTLPAGWNLIESPQSSIVLHKPTFNKSSGQVATKFSLVIKDGHSWELILPQGFPVAHNIPIFLESNVPNKLHSPSLIVNLLTIVNSAEVCIGNPNEKYYVLREYNEGRFLDHRRKLIQM